MLKQGLNTRLQNWKIIYLFLCLFSVSCTVNSKKIIKREEINSISILFTGRGREITLNDSLDDIDIPKELMCDVYFIDLNKNGKLLAYQGYGEMLSAESSDRNDLRLNVTEKKDSIVLDKIEKDKIFQIADKIYDKKEYYSKRNYTDDWLIKLTINDKINVYYLGESVDTLNEDYLDIVDEIVAKSPIKVKYYR